MKVHPEAMLPPETVHVLIPSNRPAFANVTEVSAGFQAEPDTITEEPVEPLFGVSVICGVTANEAEAESP